VFRSGKGRARAARFEFRKLSQISFALWRRRRPSSRQARCKSSLNEPAGPTAHLAMFGDAKLRARCKLAAPAPANGHSRAASPSAPPLYRFFVVAIAQWAERCVISRRITATTAISIIIIISDSSGGGGGSSTRTGTLSIHRFWPPPLLLPTASFSLWHEPVSRASRETAENSRLLSCVCGLVARVPASTRRSPAHDARVCLRVQRPMPAPQSLAKRRAIRLVVAMAAVTRAWHARHQLRESAAAGRLAAADRLPLAQNSQKSPSNCYSGARPACQLSLVFILDRPR
jgi:hypothetical protein